MEKAMIKPTTIELSSEILDNISVNDIIYAEIADPGAMGRAGNIMLYIIKNSNLICYETNIFMDEKLYDSAEKLIRDQEYYNENFDYTFYYIDGSMGNSVFMNKSIFINKDESLDIGKGFFIYNKNNEKYRIYSSCEGVFDHIVSEHTVKD